MDRYFHYFVKLCKHYARKCPHVISHNSVSPETPVYGGYKCPPRHVTKLCACHYRCTSSMSRGGYINTWLHLDQQYCWNLDRRKVTCVDISEMSYSLCDMDCDQDINKSELEEHCSDCLCTSGLEDLGQQDVPATKAWRPTSVVEERKRIKTLSWATSFSASKMSSTS